jgi:hypothetical protein
MLVIYVGIVGIPICHIFSCIILVPAKAPSNRRTRLCSFTASSEQAHRQSLDSYCWEPEHADDAGNSKHHEGSSQAEMFQLQRKGPLCSCVPQTMIGCRQPTHLPIELPTLCSWRLDRTLLEEESTKWLLKKLRMPLMNATLLVNSYSILIIH